LADAELEQAMKRLQQVGHFEWILSGPEFISSADVAKHLNAMGILVKQNTVTLWFGDLPSAFNAGALGLFAARADVIKLLAERFVRRDGKAANQ
jgi:hypothetical protein